MAKKTSEQLRVALMALGKEKQFRDQLCWCNTIDGGYCVGQPQCRAAQAALEAIEKEQAEATQEVRSGVWRHYSGKYYLVHGVGRHTENGEILVSYNPLYVHPAGGHPLQFRPLSMWLEKNVKGVQRFTFIGNELPKGIENEE
jgi:hypothetical protein